MIERVGLVSSAEVCDRIYSWCQSLGLSDQFSRFAGGPDMTELGTQEVYTVDGLPFVLAANRDMIPYLTYFYWTYRDIYLPVIEAHGGREVEGLFYPMMPEHADFRAYMKACGGRWTGNLLGAKAERVPWQRTIDRDEITRIVQECQPLAEEHARAVQERHGLTAVQTQQAEDFWRTIPELGEEVSLFYAVDRERDSRVVAAMLVLQHGRDVDCSALAFDHGDEYRPYSLATCSQLAVARWAMDEGITSLHYGLNAPGLGEYKRVFSRCQPILGLTASDLGL